MKPPDPRSRRAWLRHAGAAFVAPLAGCATSALTGGGAPPPASSYAAAMRQAIVSMAGELPQYQFRATPLGAFGVGSIYLDEMAGSDLGPVESSWYLGGPENWLAASQPADERERWMHRLVSEGSMGQVRLDGAGARDVHAQAGIALLTLLSASASVDAHRGVQTRLQADELRQRRLNWAELQAALRAGRVDRDVAEVLQRGRFVVAAADLVLVGYRAQIALDTARMPQLAAELRTKAVLPWRAGGSASLRVSETASGQFTVASAQPVVAAVLFKRPPAVAKGGAGLPTDLDAWPKAEVSEKRAADMESKVLRGREQR